MESKKNVILIWTQISDTVKTQLLSENISFVEKKPFSTTIKSEVKVKEENFTFETLQLITSQYAAQFLAQNPKYLIHPYWVCVGNHCFNFLSQHHIVPLAFEQNISELTKSDVFQKYKKCHHWSGNIVLEGMEQLFEEMNVEYSKTIVYKRNSVDVELTEHYDAVIFTSPSGVRHYMANYQLPESTVVASIGSSTTLQLNNCGIVPNIEAKMPDLFELIKKTNEFLNKELWKKMI